MKRLSAKRISALVAGAALIGMGLAFSSPVSFGNVPIISSSGQPVVQVVIGSGAKPSDGVAAANIAAAIGNLAYTSVAVTAKVNTTNAANVLKVVASSPSFSSSNAQVWLNESSSAFTGGTYGFTSLIGSVLNGAVQLGSQQNTKSLQGSSQYAYPEVQSLTVSPEASPYTQVGFVPTSTSVVASTNGGGVQFTSFQSGTNDNILRVSNSQLSGLLSNAGSYGESEYLWITGFPVYDQQSGVNSFAVLDTNGAYQAIFNKPVNAKTSSGAVNNADVSILGQNWTITGYTPPGQTVSSSSNFVVGGKLQIASALSPLTTLLVGQNVTSGPFQVVLNDLGQPNSNGISPAALSIYYNGQLTNQSSIQPQTTAQYNVSGHLFYVDVNQTFAGLYAYQKWAKIKLESNVQNITSGHVFNQTTNPNWNVELWWTNSSGSGNANSLSSIVIYGTSQASMNLQKSQSFSFITNPAVWKVQFLGDTLGNNYDPVSITSTTTGSLLYQNLGAQGVGTGVPTNITEPAQELQVTSQIPNAFSYAGQTGSSLTYDLTPYELIGNSDATNTVANAVGSSDSVLLTYNGGSDQISTTNPLIVTVSGYVSKTAGSAQSTSLTYTTLTSGTDTLTTPTGFYNITGIQLNRALPSALNVQVYVGTNSLTDNVLSTLETVPSSVPEIIYGPTSGKLYYSLTSGTSVIYNQQNGQPTTTFSLSAQSSNTVPTAGTVSTTKQSMYWTYSFGENPVPGNTAATDSVGIGIFNTTGGVQTSPYFNLNYSETGSKNNLTYVSTGGQSINVQSGFVTEKGSKIASINPSTVTLDLAKAVDSLQLSVGPSNTVATNSNFKLYGPYGIGQATNINNVSIGKVSTGNIVLSGTANYAITGINNLTATPSVTQATTPVWLQNLSTTSPLVVLDTNANPSSSLILVGSGYVNSLSQQLETAYNVSLTSPSSPMVVSSYGANRVLVAGYLANQTTAASDQFIQDLYNAASSSAK